MINSPQKSVTPERVIVENVTFTKKVFYNELVTPIDESVEFELPPTGSES